MKWWLNLVLTLATIALALALFAYPAATIVAVLCDPQLKSSGQSRLVPAWFKSAARRYDAWATQYERTRFAATVNDEHVPGTEWPMFGSVFFLVTANDLQQQGLIDARSGIVRDAVEKAAAIVASPTTGTWVKKKWGEHYLERENVFYRMLLILGLSSYEQLSGDQRHRALMSSQRISLAEELSGAKLHLKDDYPGECYPSDVLWAVAAIQRAARLEGTNHDALAKSLMETFDGPVKAAEGLPAFEADSTTGRLLQGARGCGNSGILLFASELDSDTARRWYAAYERNFWTNNTWYAGFREFAHGKQTEFSDADSGIVIWGVGSVASAFGIGAARSVGRLDHVVPLTYEAVAASWPTPLGFLLPGLLGRFAAQSWSLGEVALLFSMTRPLPTTGLTPFAGDVPTSVWAFLLFYIVTGAFFLFTELRSLRKLFRQRRDFISLVNVPSA